MQKRDEYVVDIAYPAHFHREIQPLWLASVASFLGSTPPDVGADYAYCELGCGVGINLLVAAATNPHGHFVGVDFNAAHLAIARHAAAEIGLGNIEFVQADFSAFVRDNARSFDFIVARGVWSWIAPCLRHDVLQLVARALRPGGLLYLHYMCHPGATRMIPLQKLLNEVAQQLPGGSIAKLGAGLNLLERLEGAGAFVDQPHMSQGAKALLAKDMAYLAHDFLNDHWTVEHSVDVHRQAAASGVAYLGSACVFENLDTLSIPAASQPVLAGVNAPALRETLKDLMRNQHQRQDLFQRAATRLPGHAHLALLDAIRFELLPGASRTGGLTFKTPIGHIQGPPEILSPLLERLAGCATSFAELRSLPRFAGNLGLLSQSLQMLMHQGVVHPRREDGPADAAQLARLNQWIARHSLKLRVVERCGTAIHYGLDA